MNIGEVRAEGHVGWVEPAALLRKAQPLGQPNFLLHELRVAAFLMVLLELGSCSCKLSRARPGEQSELGREGWPAESVV